MLKTGGTSAIDGMSYVSWPLVFSFPSAWNSVSSSTTTTVAEHTKYAHLLPSLAYPASLSYPFHPVTAVSWPQCAATDRPTLAAQAIPTQSVQDPSGLAALNG